MNGQEAAKILREKEIREFKEKGGTMSVRDGYLKEVKKAAKKVLGSKAGKIALAAFSKAVILPRS